MVARREGTERGTHVPGGACSGPRRMVARREGTERSAAFAAGGAGFCARRMVARREGTERPASDRSAPRAGQDGWSPDERALKDGRAAWYVGEACSKTDGRPTRGH